MSPWCPSEAMHTVARAHVARRKRTESGTKVQGWNPTLLSNSVLQQRRKRRTIGGHPDRVVAVLPLVPSRKPRGDEQRVPRCRTST